MQTLTKTNGIVSFLLEDQHIQLTILENQWKRLIYLAPTTRYSNVSSKIELQISLGGVGWGGLDAR